MTNVKKPKCDVISDLIGEYIETIIEEGFFSVLFHQIEIGTDIIGIAGRTKQTLDVTSLDIQQVISYLHNVVSDEKALTIEKNSIVRTSAENYLTGNYYVSMTMTMISNENGKSWIRIDIYNVTNLENKNILDQILKLDLSSFKDFSSFSYRISKIDNLKVKIISDELICKLKVTEHIANNIYKSKVQTTGQVLSLCSLSCIDSFLPELKFDNYVEYRLIDKDNVNWVKRNIEGYSPDLIVYTKSEADINTNLNDLTCKSQIELMTYGAYKSEKDKNSNGIEIFIVPSYDYSRKITIYTISIME